MPRKATFDRQTALKQAMDLFWSRGFHATSLKDIEAALDMRPGSIYAAFGSKESLFEGALTLYSETSRKALEDAMANAASPLEGLAAHVRNLGRMMSGPVPSRACMLMKTILESPENNSVLRVAAEKLMHEAETAFAEGFRAAQKLGQISSDEEPDYLAARLQSEILGLRAYAQFSDTANRIIALANDIASGLEALEKPPRKKSADT